MKKIFNIFALLAMVLFSACSNDDLTGNTGYLTIGVSAVTNTNTRAIPSDYNPRQLAVKIIDANNKVVQSTEDFTKWQGKKLQLLAGTYTIVASSNGWDGNDSGRDTPYYTGSTTATITPNTNSDAEIVCTQANVKVTVIFDKTISDAFAGAEVFVTSAVSGINGQNFEMGNSTLMKPAYFPVGNLNAKLTVINKHGNNYTLNTPIENVKARDHYILKYSTAGVGNGQFTITADDGETSFTYTFTVPTEASTVLKTIAANAWSNFAYLQGSIPTSVKPIVDANVKMKYKKTADATWTETSVTKDDDKNYKVTVRNLAPNTEYAFKMVYTDGDDTFESDEKTFTTEGATLLPNGNLDSWHTGKFNNKDCVYPNASGQSFWDTSNPGSSLLNKMVTTQETSDVHTPGGSAARLGSEYIVIKFAAASMYAGTFGELKGTNGATINFGQPWSDRPSQLKGWFKYKGGAINRNGGAPAGVTIDTNKTPDLWSAYIVLADEGYTFDNTNIAATAWNYETDSRVIAYGALPDAECINSSEWKQFTINLDYHSLTRKPKTIMMVFSSSKYGDYFTGCDSSVLLLDDLELVYGEPVQE